MTTSASLISALLLFNPPASDKPAAAVMHLAEPVQKEIQVPIELKSHPVLQQAVAAIPVEKKTMAPVHEKPSPVVAPAPVEVVLPEPAVAEAPAAPDAEPAPAGSPVLAVEATPDPAPHSAAHPACNPGHKFPCHCRCNDGNDVTCTFKEKLLDDEVIDDGEEFSFKIDDKSFVVNGKEQPANMYKKYSRIFRELTGRELTPGSYMRVEVTKNNCNISMNYNEENGTRGD
jgi:hypothetical protein